MERLIFDKTKTEEMFMGILSKINVDSDIAFTDDSPIHTVQGDKIPAA